MSAIQLAPVSPADRAHARSAAANLTVTAHLTPFVDADVFDALEPTVVDLVGRRVGEHRPDVLLGLALAVRAPRHGHVCVDLLGELPELPELPEAGDAPPAAQWPADRPSWVAAIASSPLVQPPPTTENPELQPFVLSGSRLYTQRCWSDEAQLAAALRARLDHVSPPSDVPLLHQGLRALFKMDPAASVTHPIDAQVSAGALAAQSTLAVITGGPGTGKTWTVRNVLTLLWAQHAVHHPDRTLRVALAAPTGKAAARVKESLTDGLATFLKEQAAGALPPGRTAEHLENFLNALEARTVHRLLRIDPRRPGRFRHTASNPVPADVVVVDETSMLDLTLMTRLVDALAPSTRLILLGDHNQLASVEAGSVLADLCSAGGRLDASVVKLTESRRFTADSGIGAVASACLDGDGNGALKMLQDDSRADIHWLPLNSASRLSPALAQLIVDGYRPYLDRLFAGPVGDEKEVAFYKDVLRKFNKFRVLTAHRAGSLGVRGLVQVTEALLARRVPRLNPRPGPYEGQPVMVTRNDYGVGRYNGDIGIVVMRDGALSVVFPEGEHLAWLSPSRLPPHETVFAMTIHKSQGSEFEHTVVVLPHESGPILSRELVYTGITRAKDLLTVAGRPDVLRAGLKRKVERATGLAEALSGAPA